MMDGQQVLSQAEVERLALLIEECAEVQQVATKILRHGYGSYNPFDENKIPNRELLNKEIGDLSFALNLMKEFYDINENAIKQQMGKKALVISQYLHHHEISDSFLLKISGQIKNQE